MYTAIVLLIKPLFSGISVAIAIVVTCILNSLKRGKTCASESRLVLVLLLIG